MRRVTVVLFALIAGLIGASTAAAQAPRPSVSTTFGSVTPAYLSGTESPRSGVGPYLIKDGFGLNPPTLMAEAGSVVTITLASTADAVVAYLGAATLPVAPAGERTYAVTVLAGAPLPARFSFRVESSTETTLLTDAWLLNLGGDVADPAPSPAPAPPTDVPAPAPVTQPVAAPTGLRLRGARLTVTVACPAAATAGCDGGSLSLKTASLRVARLAFGRLSAGASTTLRTTLPASTLRRLRRHGVRSLRAVLTPVGGQPEASQLPLRASGR
jgi:hypothetical protein